MEYYGIWTMSDLEPDMDTVEAWSKRDGIPELFTDEELAVRQAEQYNKDAVSSDVRYAAREMEPELAEFYIQRKNIAVAQAIDKAVNDSNYEPFHYKLDAAVNTVFDEYGAEQVNAVLANVLLTRNNDGRYSSDNKAWAQEFDIVPDNRVFCNTHPAILDGFISKARKITAERENETPPIMVGGYTVSHVIQFYNDRGFAYGENPQAAAPFATWQFSNEDGKLDFYWGHYYSDKDDALKDFATRISEYREDYPSLKVVAEKPLPGKERPSVADKLDAAKKEVKPPSADKKPPPKNGPEL